MKRTITGRDTPIQKRRVCVTECFLWSCNFHAKRCRPGPLVGAGLGPISQNAREAFAVVGCKYGNRFLSASKLEKRGREAVLITISIGLHLCTYVLMATVPLYCHAA